MKTIYSLLLAGLLFSADAIGQVPVYSSYPTASAAIFLDFDGHYVQGTSWNYSGPLNIEGANLTTAQMTEIYQRVAEDYRPFNVNITTDSTKYLSAPSNRRMRVLITITSSWYGNVGGVAYLNSFSWGDNTPCFVFSALLNNNTKFIAEATSHEAGHTLGLRHQSAYNENCVKTSEYHSGVGSGTTAWAPIMGVGYYRNMTLWNNGANPYGCTNFQDDLGIITSNSNGFGYRSDDHANNAGGSTLASFVGNMFQKSGVIEKATDYDVFKFIMPVNGYFHLEVLPFGISNGDVGSNVDLQVELMTSSNNVVATFNPQDVMSVIKDTALSQGTYYLRIKGVGNIYAPEYASLGSYTLTGTYSPFTALPLHQLELKGTTNENRHQLNWLVDADEMVISQTLEVSTDGINFRTVHAPTADARSFSYVPYESGTLFYRLLVVLDNGRPYYSNTLALRAPGSEKRPRLDANIIRNSISVHAPEGFDYVVTDYNGRLVARGRLVQGMNSIPASNISSGMYLIVFTNNQNRYTEKFIKQ
ncbi:MAG TPA: T9SS type A sorting domain-containing protein [Flavisolibacter sp.]